MFWLIVGGLAGILVRYVWWILVDVCLIFSPIVYTQISTNYFCPVYKKINDSAWGLGKRLVFTTGIEFGSGMFVSFKYRCVGYLYDDGAQTSMVIFAASESRMKTLLRVDPDAACINKRIDIGPYSMFLHPRVPLSPVDWQRDVIFKISQCVTRRPTDCFVCLITGAPRSGKSTLAYFLHRDLCVSGDLTVLYAESVTTTYENCSGWDEFRQIYLFDDLDSIMKDIATDRRLYSMDAAQYCHWLDLMHECAFGPTIILTSNLSYAELRALLEDSDQPELANIMLSPDRIDMVVDLQRTSSEKSLQNYRAEYVRLPCF